MTNIKHWCWNKANRKWKNIDWLKQRHVYRLIAFNKAINSDSTLLDIICQICFLCCKNKATSYLLPLSHTFQVNGIDLRQATHDEAIGVLRLTTQRVRLCVFRHQEAYSEEDLWDVFSLELRTRPGEGLGFTTVGKRYVFLILFNKLVTFKRFILIYFCRFFSNFSFGKQCVYFL